MALRLTPDRSELFADGCDVAVIRCEVIDAAGRVVPTANHFIEFETTANARILGVGNGNPNSHEPDKASSRTAFNGLVQVLVQAGRQSGSVLLQSSSSGLAGSELALTLVQKANRLPEMLAVQVASKETGKHMNSIDGAL